MHTKKLSMDVSDDALVAAMVGRDRHALAIFYKRWAPKLERFIARKIDQRQDAEEVLQDTLFAFLEAIRDFAGRASIKTYLFSICQHKVIDYYRRKKLKQIVFSQMPSLEILVSPLLAPEEAFDAAVTKQKIADVLTRLLPRYRQILLFKYIDDLSVEEIAEKLMITFKSAESQLFRARKAFVELFLSI